MQPNEIIRDYRIVKILGEGGMGEVYLAEEILLGRKVAIKRLNPSLTNDPQFSERFINEARIQARLTHENIVSLYNFFSHNLANYMVMEYAAGITLKDLILKTGPIPEERALNIFQQIISALAYAHENEVIHRDIKPSNIIVDPRDKVKVMDFGIARIMAERHLTRTGTKLGTLYYMSPEQVKASKDIDHRTDIFSAGIVLYEMLTGKLPYDTNTESDYDIMTEIMNKELPDPRKTYPHIKQSTVELVEWLTEKDKEQRPGAKKVIHHLKAALEPYQGSQDNQEDDVEEAYPGIETDNKTEKDSEANMFIPRLLVFIAIVMFMLLLYKCSQNTLSHIEEEESQEVYEQGALVPDTLATPTGVDFEPDTLATPAGIY